MILMGIGFWVFYPDFNLNHIVNEKQNKVSYINKKIVKKVKNKKTTAKQSKLENKARKKKKRIKKI